MSLLVLALALLFAVNAILDSSTGASHDLRVRVAFVFGAIALLIVAAEGSP